MPRTCTICAHPERKLIDARIANKEPFLQIATRYGLNNKTVTTHGHNCVEPVINNIELQANAAVLKRVMTYRDEVNLPLPEKSKHIENKLWADYYAVDDAVAKMAIVREIHKQQDHQAKLAGAYTAPKDNPADVSKRIDNILESWDRLGYPGTKEDAEMVLQQLDGIVDETGRPVQ